MKEDNSVEIAIINGPNMSFLGIRQKEIYGTDTLDEINRHIYREVDKISALEGINIHLEFFVSNSEGNIIDFLQNCYVNKIAGIVINPGPFSYTSYAIRDAISSVGIPTIEVKVSNTTAREDFRKDSVIAPVCLGQILGFGSYSYVFGVQALINKIKMGG